MLVDRSRGCSGCCDSVQELVDLSCRHVRSRPIAEGCHDQAVVRSVPAPMRKTRLGEQISMIAQRRGLGILDVRKPPEVRIRDFSEGDGGTCLAQTLGSLLRESFLNFLDHACLCDDRRVLIEVARFYAPAPSADRSIFGTFEPGGSDSPLHRPERTIGVSVAPACLINEFPPSCCGDNEPRTRGCFRSCDSDHEEQEYRAE